MKQYKAVEFFSGMGSFAEACREFPVTVVGAFDQSELANKVYKHNFQSSPCHANLDSIGVERIPGADIWWMSPPCTPYSVRGHRADVRDPRARSFLHLLAFVKQKLPSVIFVENVQGFKKTEVERLFLETLTAANYHCQELDLCSTDFGVPMRRPRHFVIASRKPLRAVFKPRHSVMDRARDTEHAISANRAIGAGSAVGASYVIGACDAIGAGHENPDLIPVSAISSYIKSTYNNNALVAEADGANLRRSTSVIQADDPNAIAICFTKSYYRCRRSSGSLIELPDGRLRRFTSAEMLALFGFSPQYAFPDDVTEQEATRLLGNAVDVRVIRYLLQEVLPATVSIV